MMIEMNDMTMTEITMTEMTESEWATYVLDSPLALELLEDDPELLLKILEA
ncbi:hypothetical protein [Shewanella sp.]|uniref:hypothetical protein n=1 Tax=Shewanella sp. TaxID=50422 RepID=UPI0040475892